MSPPTSGALSFDEFLARTRRLNRAELGDARVVDTEQFEAMRRYVLEYYEGVEVRSSFVDETGQVWDCVSFESQPSSRSESRKGKGSPPPLPPPAPAPSASHESRTPTKFSAAPAHSLGEGSRCPEGTVPVRRITLADLARFSTLADFFGKSGPASPAGLPPR